MLRHPSDNRIHWSNLKMMLRSPAHYRESVLTPKDPTPSMVLGSVVDAMVFGGRRVSIFEGRKSGKQWDLFKSDCDPTALIVSSDQYAQCKSAADAVRADPVARPLLIGEGVQHQRVIQWEEDGLPFAAGIAGERGGFDVLGPEGEWLADLKGTSDTSPTAWARQAMRMMYHCQLSHYQDGAKANGYSVPGDRLYLIGFEFKAPHTVTVLRLTPTVLDLARKTLRLMKERLRACEAEDRWPGYSQSVVDLDAPAYVELDGFDE